MTRPIPSATPSHEYEHDHECSPTLHGLSRRNLLAIAAALPAAVAVAGSVTGTALAAPTAKNGGVASLTLDDLVPGFLEIVRDEWGAPVGNAWAGATNPWGTYTAHRVHRTQDGLRTWRIDNYLPGAPRADGSSTSQDSTCWLFEGHDRALLVDTAQNTAETMGVNDLTTVTHHLLGHDDDGSPRANPVDFDVSITHNHGDHTGKLFQMTTRTVYYPDLDWPRTPAPANWVPVRDDGGATVNGSTGSTVKSIDLGGRTIQIVALYGHTPGSTGYLDVANKLIATGDALGSAFVWAQFASATTSTYVGMLRNLRALLTPLNGVALLPAHFDQLRMFSRGQAPLNGRIGDLDYVKDMITAAEGALDGSIAAEPYFHVGREAVWIGGGSSRLVYSLTNMYPGGAGTVGDYHRVQIPSRYLLDPWSEATYAYLRNIRTDLQLIRDHGNRSLYLMRGSKRALLIGTGVGSPGLLAFVRRTLAGSGVPLEVIVTSGDDDQLGGLEQFRGCTVHAFEGTDLGTGRTTGVVRHRAGDVIDLGRDSSGRTVGLEVQPLPGHSSDAITLLDATSRVLFAGDALGTQGGSSAGLVLSSSDLAGYQAALSGWRAHTDGAFDTLYTAHNHQWFTRPAYVDSVATAVAAGVSNPGAFVASPLPGHRGLTAGTGDVQAFVHVPA
ncbi:MBL fold metallo-hydrolase [Aestuariimicrobium soli]|uniref:MBL fold metallo-hydrolase n=1 Tax=Aestuariimicrobium soli TaxID=2035834 RepID=UPI003EBED5C8